MMKVTWETSDITGGRRFGSPNTDERFMIGYAYIASNPKPTIAVISLCDGMTTLFHDAETVVSRLNECEYVPMELLSKK